MHKNVVASAVRRFLSPSVLAGVTLVGTMGFASVAMASGAGESPAASGSPSAASLRSASSHHSVMAAPGAHAQSHVGGAMRGGHTMGNTMRAASFGTHAAARSSSSAGGGSSVAHTTHSRI